MRSVSFRVEQTTEYTRAKSSNSFVRSRAACSRDYNERSTGERVTRTSLVTAHLCASLLVFESIGGLLQIVSEVVLHLLLRSFDPIVKLIDESIELTSLLRGTVEQASAIVEGVFQRVQFTQ